MFVLPKEIPDLMQSLSRFQCIFHKTRKKQSYILCGNTKDLEQPKKSKKKKNKAGGTVLPLYYKAIVLKQNSISIKTDTQINGTEKISPETNPHIYIN